MSTLFDQAIYTVARLPKSHQDAIARAILEGLDADVFWHTPLINWPCSEADLDHLADDARANLARLNTSTATR